MFLATANKAKRLLHVSYIQHVRAEELRRGREDVAALIVDLPAGFRVLVDLGRLDSMDLDCAPEIGRIMELYREKKPERLVRVIPDPQKDIGLRILTLFHFGYPVSQQTCETMEEAARLLSL